MEEKSPLPHSPLPFCSGSVERIFGAITMPIDLSEAASATRNYSSLSTSTGPWPAGGGGGSQRRPKRFVTLMDLCRPRKRPMLLAASRSISPLALVSFYPVLHFVPSQFFHFPLFD